MNNLQSLLLLPLFVEYQPTACSAIRCKDTDTGVGKEADCPPVNHTLTCKAAWLERGKLINVSEDE